MSRIDYLTITVTNKNLKLKVRLLDLGNIIYSNFNLL